MLTTILSILIASLMIIIIVPRIQAKRSARRQPVYICDVCNSQDCLCREKH